MTTVRQMRRDRMVLSEKVQGRHQDRHAGRLQHLFGDAAVDPAADPGPAVAPHHDHRPGVLLGTLLDARGGIALVDRLLEGELRLRALDLAEAGLHPLLLALVLHVAFAVPDVKVGC